MRPRAHARAHRRRGRPAGPSTTGGACAPSTSPTRTSSPSGRTATSPATARSTPLLADDDVWEIMINAPDAIFVKRHRGASGYHDEVFHDDDHVVRTLTKILDDASAAHRKLDPAEGLQDAQLDNGARLHIVHGDIARGGHVMVNIRKFTGVAFRDARRAGRAGHARRAAGRRRSCGPASGPGSRSCSPAPPGSGKTTLLSCCAAELDPSLRVVIAEEVFEADVPSPNVASACRPEPARADRPAVDLRRLVAGFLRMAPDVAIVGEVRDREALPLLLTLSSGVKGFTTIHAGSARQALTRLRFICQLADTASELPLAALNSLVSARRSTSSCTAPATPDGPRVTEVVAVEDLAGGPDATQFTVTEVFRRARRDAAPRVDRAAAGPGRRAPSRRPASTCAACSASRTRPAGSATRRPRRRRPVRDCDARSGPGTVTALLLPLAAASASTSCTPRSPCGWRGVGLGARRRPHGATGAAAARRSGWSRPASTTCVRAEFARRRWPCCWSLGAALAFAVFGAILPAAGRSGWRSPPPSRSASYRARRADRRARAQEAWPRMIEEIRILTGSLGSLGPPGPVRGRPRGPRRDAARVRRRAPRVAASPPTSPAPLAVLKDRLADPTADATCETLLVAHERRRHRPRPPARRPWPRTGSRTSRAARTPGPSRPASASPGASCSSCRSAWRWPGCRSATGAQAYARRSASCSSLVAVAHGRRLLDVGRPHHAAARGGAGVRRDDHGCAVARRLSRSWVGATLVLRRSRVVRPPLARRPAAALRARRPGHRRRWPTGCCRSSRSARSSARSPRTVGERVARLFGVNEDLGRPPRARPHADLDATAFRVRQLGCGGRRLRRRRSPPPAIRPPALVVLLFLVGAPLLAFLVVEQQLAVGVRPLASAASSSSCPVVAEQLGMLLSAGYSLGAALNRLATRGQGACGQDLARVVGRIRQGSPRSTPCGSGPPSPTSTRVDRLVAVLALNREAGDLGRLISEEARAIRRDVQRELVEPIERREPAGLDPRHGRRARARRDLPGRPVHRGHAPLQHLLIPDTPGEHR